MQIPNQFSPYELPTFVVVSDHIHARLFLLDNRQMNEVGLIESDYPPKDRMERTTTITPSGLTIKEESEHLKEESARRLFQKISDDLHLRLQKGEFQKLIVVISPDCLQEIQDALSTDVRARLIKIIPKNLLKHTSVDLLSQLQSA